MRAQGLAYAAIAGIDVTYGLYASLFPAVLYTFFGTSKDLSVGPSPIMASLMARLFLVRRTRLISIIGTRALMLGPSGGR